MSSRLFNTLLCAVLAVLPAGGAVACTSFIVSGRATKDGRPMIFKNRDTDNRDNCIVMRQGEKYRYVAVTGANDTTTLNVWSGHNEKGFAIINTAAYNLNGNVSFADEHDGIVMRRALEVCATLRDFEQLLDTISYQNINSNYGVIDASGGCAYYEAGQHHWRKFDANDPAVAPYGYLCRTNHAFSGDRSLDMGTERMLAISSYMSKAQLAGGIDAVSLVRGVPRWLVHGLTGINVADYEPDDASRQVFFPFVDYIPRFSTASVQLIQGVRPGENPSHTVAWTIIGTPLATVVLPVVISPSGRLPQVVTGAGHGGSRLCHYGLSLKRRLFPLRVKSRSNYIDVAQLVNRQGTGVLQQIRPIEDELVKRALPVVASIHDGKAFPVTAVDDYYRWADGFIVSQYKEKFGLE